MSRFNYESSATVYRIGYVGNAGSYSATGDVYEGFFQPIDNDNNTTAIQMMGQGYQFVTEGDADIQASDKLVIDGVEYRVRGIKRNVMKRHDFLTALLEEPLKNT